MDVSASSCLEQGLQWGSLELMGSHGGGTAPGWVTRVQRVPPSLIPYSQFSPEPLLGIPGSAMSVTEVQCALCVQFSSSLALTGLFCALLALLVILALPV